MARPRTVLPDLRLFRPGLWGWKFTDFLGARFQEGVCTLAYLWTTPLADNPFYQAPHVRHGCKPDYAFGNACSTAMARSTKRIRSSTVWQPRRLRVSISASPCGVYARAGQSTVLWCRRWPGLVIGSAATTSGTACSRITWPPRPVALYGIFRLTGEARFERRCWHFVQRIYDHQSAEGWYEEYGGADPGYQTHGTFYLAWLWHHTRDAMLQASLERSVVFLKHFIHPNGTLGGEYGSRNTEFYFPACFEILAAAIPDAARIAHFMRPWVTAHTMACLWTMDLYNMFPMLNNYLLATDYAAPRCSTRGSVALPHLW